MSTIYSKVIPILSILLLGLTVGLLWDIRNDLSRPGNLAPDSATFKFTPFSIEEFQSRSEALRTPRQWMKIAGFLYYPVRDKNLTPEMASKIIQLIDQDEEEAKDLLFQQVSQQEITKYDTLIASQIEIKITSDYDDARVWINGFDVRLAGKYILIKNVPLRPENIHLVIMVHFPDEAKLEGLLKINGKEVEFEFKDLKAIDFVKKDFKFSEFSIEPCKYIPPCVQNPV